MVEDDLDQDRDGQLPERGDDREHDRRPQADAQLRARAQALAQDRQRARARGTDGGDVVVLEGGEDPLGELVACLGRGRVGHHVVRGAVHGLVAGTRHHATSWS